MKAGKMKKFFMIIGVIATVVAVVAFLKIKILNGAPTQ
jgi:hypothetical protein